jgi:hypothetical protein
MKITEVVSANAQVNRSVGLELVGQASACPLLQQNNSREQRPRIRVTLEHDDGRGVMAER